MRSAKTKPAPSGLFYCPENMELPDLPNVESENPLDKAKRFAKVLDGMRTGNVGGLDYELKKDKLAIETMVRDAKIKALLGYDGNININASKPIYGGTLDVTANRVDGKNNFGIQFQKRF